ncbi:hypothetical protein ACHAWF_004561 [Thalassiosira exigua]
MTSSGAKYQQLQILGVVALGYLLAHLHRIDLFQTHEGAIVPSRRLKAKSSEREVHAGTMCRCHSGALAVPGRMSEAGLDTAIVQPPSKATGAERSKRFFVHLPEEEGKGCTCLDDHPAAEPTTDVFLKQMPYPRTCHKFDNVPSYDWKAMPELGVEEGLPLFVGVLSYESPLSLNHSLHNWRDRDFFDRIGAREVFLQLNHRSPADQKVADDFNEVLKRDGKPPVTVMGSPSENLHPGLAISKFCRAAEAHPNSHPNGENLLLFLEKDWNLETNGPREDLGEVFRSIRTIAQRGVPYVRLNALVKGTINTWNCPSRGVSWVCTTAHQHRWTNLPSVVSCRWFLRYLEPFALLDDPIMYGCRPGMRKAGYCDWEEALQDGRVAWTNSQWVIAAKSRDRPVMFRHHEVDG